MFHNNGDENFLSKLYYANNIIGGDESVKQAFSIYISAEGL